MMVEGSNIGGTSATARGCVRDAFVRLKSSTWAGEMRGEVELAVFKNEYEEWRGRRCRTMARARPLLLKKKFFVYFREGVNG